jgi:hypothetical protein
MAWARQYEADQRAKASAESALDMIEAALKDSRFDVSPMLRELIAPLLLTSPRTQPDAARARHITTWLDLMARAWGSQRSAPLGTGSLDDDDAATDDAPPAPPGAHDDDAPDNVIDLAARTAGEKS